MTNRLRGDLPPLPPAIAALPVDERGYPVPWFVAWLDGKPEFRVVAPGKIDQAIRARLCWVCGTPLGIEKTFVIGPMCSINRVSAEPPCHQACAEFSARACPFLTKPQMVRRENNLPNTIREGAGHMIKRNPGVVALWTTQGHYLHDVGDGVLFRIGFPLIVTWWAEGRTATRAEVEASIDSGLPLLQEMATQQGSGAEQALRDMTEKARRWLPAA